MKLRHLKVERFRGIQALDWVIPDGTVCLVGPGDSKKTTVLDSIAVCLWPRPFLQFADADFHNGDTSQNILIDVTVGQLPEQLLREDKFGLDLRGWAAGKLLDEPEGGAEPVLTIRLIVSDDLEPNWVVVNDRRPEGRSISARDRELLGVIRIGQEIDRHLAWGRGSMLSRLTEAGEVERVLGSVAREARDAIGSADLTALRAAAAQAHEQAVKLGSGLGGTLVPALDTRALGGANSAIVLYQEGVAPLSSAGLGTRRLAALGLESLAVPDGAIVLIDEVESGLEPYRLRFLLRQLRRNTDAAGQVLLTTHSSVALMELRSSEISVLRSREGSTAVRALGSQLQALVWKNPEAFHARRLVVCEGPTEMGILKALTGYWAAVHADVSFPHLGVDLVNGEGGSAPATAEQLATLGYETALFMDNDVPIQSKANALRSMGVAVVQWQSPACTEEVVIACLPYAALRELIDLAVDARNSEFTVRDDIVRESQIESLALNSPYDIFGLGLEEADVRGALARTAKKAAWFKRPDKAEKLGDIVADYLPQMGGSDVATTLGSVESWIYG